MRVGGFCLSILPFWKAKLLEDGDKKYIAKFSSSEDIYSVVKLEFIAMRLAKIAGLNVANVSLAKASNKDVLLIERFDRIKTKNGWERKIMVSALTMLELDELMARYTSYEDMAEIVRKRFTNPKATLKELFSRIIFNILCGRLPALQTLEIAKRHLLNPM